MDALDTAQTPDPAPPMPDGWCLDEEQAAKLRAVIDPMNRADVARIRAEYERRTARPGLIQRMRKVFIG